ncbi:hypothetical protein LIA77_03242 [Sarocladium implicatum]|nr:hypothetical protein LIA77_03242 [Sarocladium implicatum]
MIVSSALVILSASHYQTSPLPPLCLPHVAPGLHASTSPRLTAPDSRSPLNKSLHAAISTSTLPSACCIHSSLSLQPTRAQLRATPLPPTPTRSRPKLVQRPRPIHPTTTTNDTSLFCYSHRSPRRHRSSRLVALASTRLALRSFSPGKHS